jgi:hypothetical protein
MTSAAAALALVAVVSAAPPADTARDDENVAEWTIMVFLNGDNNLEPFGLKDFEEMAQVGSTDKVNIVVQFDRSPSFSGGQGNWTQTLRFLVKKDMKPLPADAVEDIGEVNMGDGQVLADFVNWAKEKFPAKHYMLDIWDHGQGWRFQEATRVMVRDPDGLAADSEAHLAFREKQLEKVPARFRGEADSRALPREDQVVEGTVRYISSDDTSNDHLFNREIQDSLEEALVDERLDLIGFDACLMAMVETAYAMRNVANVMVGSEELEPGDGWDYERFLTKLIDNPTMDAEGLGQVLVDAYKERYSGDDETVTLSAVRLSQIRRQAGAINRFANACQVRLGSEGAMLREAREACENYAPGYGLHGIDLDCFCEQVEEKTSDGTLQSRAKAVRTEIQALVIHNYAGTERQGNFGSKGLAIYFPLTKALFDVDPDNEGYLESNTNYPVQFVQDYRWDNFLHAYFVLNP